VQQKLLAKSPLPLVFIERWLQNLQKTSLPLYLRYQV